MFIFITYNFHFRHDPLTKFAFYPRPFDKINVFLWSFVMIRILSAAISQNSCFFRDTLTKWEFFYCKKLTKLIFFSFDSHLSKICQPNFYNFRSPMLSFFNKFRTKSPLLHSSSSDFDLSKIISIYNTITIQRVSLVHLNISLKFWNVYVLWFNINHLISGM